MTIEDIERRIAEIKDAMHVKDDKLFRLRCMREILCLRKDQSNLERIACEQGKAA